MKNFDWKSKLTSRKFWAAVVSFVTMLVVALGGSDALATQITGLIMAGASVVAYIIGEGLADAANAKKADTANGATENNAEQKEGDGKTTETTPETPSETAADNADETKQNSD